MHHISQLNSYAVSIQIAVYIQRFHLQLTEETAAVMSGIEAEAPAGSTDACPENAVPQTGNGEWTYRVVPDWGQLPPGVSFGGTHGAIATNKAGLVYVSTQSETGVLIYSPDGALLRTIAHEIS